MKFIIFSIFFLSFLKTAFADCDSLYTYKNSDEVFIGTVVRMEYSPDTSGRTYIKVTLKLHKKYKTKGVNTQDSIVVYSLPYYLGYYWDFGETYLVFGVLENSKFYVNMCSSTTKIKGYEYDDNGSYIGSPTLDEIKYWGPNSHAIRKWKKE